MVLPSAERRRAGGSERTAVPGEDSDAAAGAAAAADGAARRRRGGKPGCGRGEGRASGPAPIQGTRQDATLGTRPTGANTQRAHCAATHAAAQGPRRVPAGQAPRQAATLGAAAAAAAAAAAVRPAPLPAGPEHRETEGDAAGRRIPT